VTSAKVEPQVAVVCDVRNPVHPQFMDSAGKWVSDTQIKNSCMKDKVEILEFCRKVYRSRNITNIVEAPRSVKIDNWCTTSKNRKCNTVRSVKPYRCLEGAFQSEALLVPEQCVFDHVHNASRCWSYDQWNLTAASACSGRDLKLRSFAILLPCGVDLFSGVEFVCCPRSLSTDAALSSAQASKSQKSSAKDDDLDASDADDDDDIDDDDEDEEEDALTEDKDDKKTNKNNADDADDDYDEDEENQVDSDEDDDLSSSSSTTTSTTTTTTTTTQKPKPSPTPDPYLTHYNPKKERDDFLDAEQRLEERHRDRVTKIMKDWSELEDRYQELRVTDAKGAEEFKRKMTNRFQKLVKAMEDEDVSEKRQLSAVHQQRVLAAINEKKRDAMACYTDALNETPANTHRIQKCLEKLLRSLHKDRHHSVAHFRHLLNMNPAQAQREKEATIQHLNDIDRLTNQSLQMLDRYPEIQAKIVPMMRDHLMALRSKDDTPSPLLATRTSEEDVLDSYKAEIVNKQAERQLLSDKARKEDERRRDERKKLDAKNKKMNQLDANLDAKTESPKDTSASLASSTKMPEFDVSTTTTPKPVTGDKVKVKKDEIAKKEKVKDKKVKEQMNVNTDVQGVQGVQHVQEHAKVAHAQSHQIAHSEPVFSVRHENAHHENRSVYFTLAFAGLALLSAMVVGMILLKRRHARSPYQQGFIEVDQAVSPEERHVANMQINGYENPTYKYFEAKE